MSDKAWVLVLDTCGEQASAALFRGSELVDEKQLEARTASVALLAAMRQMLCAHAIELCALSGVGVVSGPGSFTGVRVGLSMAKGICEAAGLPLAAVSRLEMLAETAGMEAGFALLSAGRDQAYVYAVEAKGVANESMAEFKELIPRLRGARVTVASSDLAERLTEAGIAVQTVGLSARNALRLVHRCLAEGGSDVAIVDANYVRSEQSIYRRKDMESASEAECSSLA